MYTVIIRGSETKNGNVLTLTSINLLKHQRFLCNDDKVIKGKSICSAVDKRHSWFGFAYLEIDHGLYVLTRLCDLDQRTFVQDVWPSLKQSYNT